MPDAVEQRNTILNLYESGIDPEIIAFELDVSTDAVLEVIENESLSDRSLELGDYFMSKLREIKNPLIKEVRGKGLFIGVELHEKARKYCEALKEEGLLCKETHENVIRFAPPLVIEKEDLDWALERIKKVLS